MNSLFARCLVSVLAALLGFSGAPASAQNHPPATPTITEPSVDNKVLNPQDVHMETSQFSDSDAGDFHTCSAWEILVASTSEQVWTQPCIGGVERLHIHLGDGTFVGSHAGRHSLLPQTQYTLRARHRDSSGDTATQWSGWVARPFSTGSLSTVFPLLIDDIVEPPVPTWTDPVGSPVILAGGISPASFRIESAAGELLLQFRGFNGLTNQYTNPAALAAHVNARAKITAGSTTLALPATDISITDNSGQDRVIYAPPLSLAAGQSMYLWISDNGSTYIGTSSQTQPDFSTLARGAAVPWAVRQPGYQVEVFATGFALPINIAFVPNPGAAPTSPLFYVTELYGNIKVVRRNGTVGLYATNLLNFSPTGDFPGSGEQGVAGVAVDPISGDVFASMLYDSLPPNGPHYPKVVRFHSLDGGQTASTQTTILNMVGETQGQSHQISNLEIQPDGKLYVHVGDGFDATKGQNLNSFRGKILRVNLDGTAPADNPFYNATNGITATDYVFAYGLRNPFGGCYRALDGFQYEVENGPDSDRFARVVRGRNYLYDGSDASMLNYSIYNWIPAHAPVNIAWVQSQSFSGSGFPAEKQDHAFVTESGPTFATGPQPRGKRVSEFSLTAGGVLVTGPTPLIEYNGSGYASCSGIAAGPDGLYFTDLYKDQNIDNAFDPGANVLRIKFVGTADFTAPATSGVAPLPVQFFDTSSVPGANSWQWVFGDGATSTMQNPSHVYTTEGVFNVRLSVTGSNGVAVTQKNGFVRVGVIPRIAFIGGNPVPNSAEATIISSLTAKGYDAVYFDDEPANRPNATTLANQFGLVVVSSTVTSTNIAGEFRAVNVPLVFWESALLQAGRESLTSIGKVVNDVYQVNIVNNTHPVTAGLALGTTDVYLSSQTMSVGNGTIPPGATVLAARTGFPNDAAILVAEKGSQLLDYFAPARRVFLFLEDASYNAATPQATQILSQSLCWALGNSPTIVAQPSSISITAGHTASFTLTTGGQFNLQHQWLRDGVALNNGPAAGGGVISGAKSKTLTITPANNADIAAYQCRVSNDCGTVTSDQAFLGVTGCGADFTGDGFVTGDDFDFFVVAFEQGFPSADFDGDGFVTGDDFDFFVLAFEQGC